jgi:hypothetical protein
MYNLETFEEKLGKAGVVQESGMGGVAIAPLCGNSSPFPIREV